MSRVQLPSRDAERGRGQVREPDHQRRFARRTMRRRARRARPWLLALAGLAAMGGVVWVFFFSTLFAATAVEVEGGTRVDEATIRASAEVPLGGPLARVDLDAVQTRVAALPALLDVRVSRGWPNAVRITVTDRLPVAALAGDGTWRLVDADGFTWGSSASAPRGLPVVRAGSGVRRAAVAEAARVVTALPRGLAEQVAQVQVTTIDRIDLRLDSGLLVRWGSAEQSVLKADVLGSMLQSETALMVGEDPATAVDVSVPTQPTVSR